MGKEKTIKNEKERNAAKKTGGGRARRVEWGDKRGWEDKLVRGEGLVVRVGVLND